MTNADKFKSLFGLYATELWAMPEKDFLKWLNSEVDNCSESPNSSDTISRQAAIDALDDIESEVADGDGFQYEKWREYFCELPSAQPERTCVNCGRTVNNGGWYADGGTRCPIEEHYALPKDGYCHLWEKRNITDDDYPERREDERPES